ncbi:serine hydrolase FSH [Durotheca rogersii]|uniref:serine hydrolase FSH n=1 Tax=Durotheca rogersii TaxID=419775 RepID=UPI0022203C08|nr:serine hydrolase FSH [Durotheca rogersii]KAI5862545.1 serine hydrolase FSH [Durotheca rogersii]
MRILCLHGDGQSGETLQSDLVPLLSQLKHLDRGLSFELADGPLPCVDGERSGYKFFRTAEARDIRKSHEWLAAKLDRDGGYDGVIAYSQGAALVSSFLLCRQWYEHELPAPFRFAVFLSGSLPLEVLKGIGVPVSREAERVAAEAELQRDRRLGPLRAHAARARRALFDSDDCFGLNLNRVPLELKIRIPTVHVWGEADPLFPAAVQLAGLCDPYIRKTHAHAGARDIPRDGKQVAALAELVEWCVSRAAWPGQTQL